MSLTYKSVVDEILFTLQGYGFRQPPAAYLTESVNTTDTGFSLGDVSQFTQGLAEIEGELVFINTVDYTNNILTIAPDGRGYYGTTAATHAMNARIDMNPVWPRTRVKDVVNDIILGTYPTLFGVSSSTFTSNPTVTTYSVPAEAERILSVTADTFGSSKEQQIVHRYSFNSVAPTSEWSTTNTLTLQECVDPGATVTVNYLKQPTALSADTDLFTASGLRESAKKLVVYGACAQLLSYMDAARTPVNTAIADQMGSNTGNAPGSAIKIAATLLQFYAQELEKERQRLRATTPVPLTVRTR